MGLGKHLPSVGRLRWLIKLRIRMKHMHKLLMLLYRVLIVSAIGWGYGNGRIMQPAFGASLRGCVSGVICGGALAVIFFHSLDWAYCVATLDKRRTKEVLCRKWCLKSLSAMTLLVIGCMLGEAYIELDELCFARYVQDAHIVSFDRPRWFPFDGTALLYATERGFWAND